MNQQEQIFRSLAVIEAHIREKLTVKELANSIYLSKHHYQRVFREAMGESVMRYVARRRLTLAAQELAATDQTVLDIALAYGYDSHEGFTRRFRGHVGVQPTAYRKYHRLVSLPQTRKEKRSMLYAKPTEEIIRHLNGLIVQAKEASAHSRAPLEADPALACYLPLCDLLAKKADQLAESLSRTAGLVNTLTENPEAISARFLMLQAVEEAALQSERMAFQAQLITARAMPDHQAALKALCAQYEALAEAAQVKTQAIADFFQELTGLIFQDMRETAQKLLKDALFNGRAAVRLLLDHPQLPYGHFIRELNALIEALEEKPLEEITAGFLEEQALRLEMVAFSAEIDLLRAPAHQPLLAGIPRFQQSLREAAGFFQSLGSDLSRTLERLTRQPAPLPRLSAGGDAGKRAVLLFSIQGELEKLASRLTDDQRRSLRELCCQLERLNAQPRETAAGQWQAQCQALAAQAEKLGRYGPVIGMLAGELAAL